MSIEPFAPTTSSQAPTEEVELLSYLYRITPAQAHQLADLLDFLASDLTRHVRGYVEDWRRLKPAE